MRSAGRRTFEARNVRGDPHMVITGLTAEEKQLMARQLTRNSTPSITGIQDLGGDRVKVTFVEFTSEDLMVVEIFAGIMRGL